MTTVADILGARDTLPERAKAAHEAAQDAEKQRREALAEDLARDLGAFMRDVLGITEAEVADCTLQYGRYNPTMPTVTITVEGVALRARYTMKEIMKTKSDQFGEEKVFDRELTVEVRERDGSTMKTIESLADLGAVLS